MEGLGRNFNAVATADDANTRVPIKGASQVSLIIATANEVTLQQHTAATGGTTTALNIDHLYEQTSGAWSRVAVDPASNVFTPGTTFAVVEIDTKALDDDVTHISAAVGATLTGTFTWVLNDLTSQRAPAELAALA